MWRNTREREKSWFLLFPKLTWILILMLRALALEANLTVGLTRGSHSTLLTYAGKRASKYLYAYNEGVQVNYVEDADQFQEEKGKGNPHTNGRARADLPF